MKYGVGIYYEREGERKRKSEEREEKKRMEPELRVMPRGGGIGMNHHPSLPRFSTMYAYDAGVAPAYMEEQRHVVHHPQYHHRAQHDDGEGDMYAAAAGNNTMRGFAHASRGHMNTVSAGVPALVGAGGAGHNAYMHALVETGPAVNATVPRDDNKDTGARGAAAPLADDDDGDFQNGGENTALGAVSNDTTGYSLEHARAKAQEAKIAELTHMLSAALDAVETSRHECDVAVHEAAAARRAADAADELRQLAVEACESAEGTDAAAAVSSSVVIELNNERRARLELSSQLSQLHIDHEVMQRRRRVDDLRLTSMSEDITMLTANTEGLERVLQAEHDMRVHAEDELETLKAGQADGLKKMQVQNVEHEHEVDRLMRERDRYKTLSSTLHDEVARLRKDFNEEMRKRITLEKKLDTDIASEDVRHAVRVVEDIVNDGVDDTSRELQRRNKSNYTMAGIRAPTTTATTTTTTTATTLSTAPAANAATKKKKVTIALPPKFTADKPRATIDIHADFVPPDDMDADNDDDDNDSDGNKDEDYGGGKKKTTTATVKPPQGGWNAAAIGNADLANSKKRKTGNENAGAVDPAPAFKTDTQRKHGISSAPTREALVTTTNKVALPSSGPMATLKRTNITSSWRGGSSRSGSSVNIPKAYVDTIPTNLLLGSAFANFQVPKLKK